MRRFFGITLPLLAVCMMTGNVALAQGRGRGRGGFPGFGGPGMLLGNPQVQKELKMNEDQVAKIGEMQREMFAGFGGGGQGGQNLSDEEQQKRREERQKKAAENNKKMLELLDADQNARLKQIQLSVGGIAALGMNEEAAKALKLTDDQKEALKTINEEAGQKRQELGGGGRGGSDEEQAQRREKFTALGKETEAECAAVLTDEQKAQFEKMKGPKFELDMSGFGRGGPGGRQGRPGANNN